MQNRKATYTDCPVLISEIEGASRSGCVAQARDRVEPAFDTTEAMDETFG